MPDAHEAHQEKRRVEDGGEIEVFVGVKRDVDQISGDPEEPVFEALAIEEPLGAEA